MKRTKSKEEPIHLFFPNPHNSWSRIDMVWMNAELRRDIEEVEIMLNIWASFKSEMEGTKKKKREGGGL